MKFLNYSVWPFLANRLSRSVTPNINNVSFTNGAAYSRTFGPLKSEFSSTSAVRKSRSNLLWGFSTSILKHLSQQFQTNVLLGDIFEFSLRADFFDVWSCSLFLADINLSIITLNWLPMNEKLWPQVVEHQRHMFMEHIKCIRNSLIRIPEPRFELGPLGVKRERNLNTMRPPKFLWLIPKP